MKKYRFNPEFYKKKEFVPYLLGTVLMVIWVSLFPRPLWKDVILYTLISITILSMMFDKE